MLRLCATKEICATLRDSKKLWCDHCDLNGVFRDFTRPKCLRHFARPKKKYFANLRGLKMYVATIATQNGHVATFCDRRNLSEFVRPKTDMLRHCDPKKICCDH